MKKTVFKIAAFGVMLMACQDPNFQPGATDVAQQDTNEEDRQVLIEDYTAAEPIQVGGAFLHCSLVEQSVTQLSVGCGLFDEQNFIKINEDLDVEMRSVTIDDREQIIESVSNEERTMWTTTVARDSQIKSLILVFRKGPWNRSFKSPFPEGPTVQLSNFRLGDNVAGAPSTLVEPNPCIEIEAAQQAQDSAEISGDALQPAGLLRIRCVADHQSRRVTVFDGERVLVPSRIREVDVDESERGVHVAKRPQRGDEVEGQALNQRMHERRLERRHEPVHVIERCLTFDAERELMVLVARGLELASDHSQVHERHHDLPVVHQPTEHRC